MKNNKINIELDMQDLLGLLPYKKDTLEYDLNFIILSSKYFLNSLESNSKYLFTSSKLIIPSQ